MENWTYDITDLQPCPFCGKKEDEHGAQTLFFGCKGNSQYIIRCVPCDMAMTDDRKDKVQANWNTRNGIHPMG